MNGQIMARLDSAGRPKTPARPLYAARLPPIQHPLGAPNSPRVENLGDEATHSEPIVSSPPTIQVPKIRPTTARPVGTQLSAKTSMSGTAPGGLKPLPAIGEPYRKGSSRSRNVKMSPLRLALKCLMICMFLSIPVIIFVVMMILSGGFAPIPEQNPMSLPANTNTTNPVAPSPQGANIPTNPTLQSGPPSAMGGAVPTSFTTFKPPQVMQNTSAIT